MHIIDLLQYEDSIKKIEMNIIHLRNQTQIPRTLLHNLKHLKENFNSIIPHHVSKRGLFNIVGKGLRLLTGVMDDDEREEINKHLNTIEQNNRQIIKNVNDQVFINKQISDQIKNITDHVNLVQDNISSKLNKFKNQIVKVDNEVKFFIILMEINENINILIKQISNIKEIILASKLEILTRDVLTQKEIEMNNVTVETLPYVKTNVLFKENTIIFVISIPNFVKADYFRTVIQKIPNKNNSLELDSEIKKIIVCNQDIFVNIEKRNIMKKELVVYKDQCISKLLKNEQIKCKYHKNVTESIELLSNGIVITKNLAETLLVNNCGQQMGIRIKGNNIIKFTNCSISINDVRFENTMEEYHPMILPYVERNITIQQVVNEVQLQHLHHKSINNTKQIEEIEVTTTHRWHLNLIVDSIISVVIIAIGIYVYTRISCKKEKPHVNIHLKDYRQESIAKEGGVTSRNENLPFE